MVASSRSSKKRRGDGDDSDDGRRNRDRIRSDSHSRSRSSSPKQKRSRRREKEKQSTPPSKEDYAESLSIEETNKLRAKLGLAPLEIDDNAKTKESEDGATIHIEDGFEFRHKKPENWSDKKREAEMKEKLEIAKKKRQIYERMLTTKSIVDSDDEEDAADWVAKMRKQEEEKKLAEERAKMLDAMDEEFGINSIIEDEKAKQAKKKYRKDVKVAFSIQVDCILAFYCIILKHKASNSDTGGLVIGHSKEAFFNPSNQILVLEDKDVLDVGDEVLINPNLIENEKYARCVELKKRRELQRGFDDVDEFGVQKSYGILNKYDEELEGVKREKFRLDERGGYDLEKDEREERLRRELELAGKTLVNMDMQNYKVGSEFYTKEEMTEFRKVKKGKKEKPTRKRKILKAEDLVPDKRTGERDFGSRNADKKCRSKIENSQGEMSTEEDGTEKKNIINKETNEVSGSWKRATSNAVNIEMLKSLINQDTNDDDEESDEECEIAPNVSNIVIDDDAEDELFNIIDKTRRLRQFVIKREDDDVAHKVHEMVSSHQIKMEIEDPSDAQHSDVKDGTVTLDSTMEYCRNIGDIPTYGLAGNRTDAIDVSEMKDVDEEDKNAIKKWKQSQIEKELRRRDRHKTVESKGKWLDKPSSSGIIDSDDERDLQEIRDSVSPIFLTYFFLTKFAFFSKVEYSDDDDDDSWDNGNSKKEYENVLGKEADVSKGVGAMLKLAAQKGYLNDNEVKKKTGQNLDHLRNQSKTQIEQGKYDIEDKYAKKLDRLGTTGRGPIMPFTEKKDYRPEVNIQYVDEKGRIMDQKDAYRELSYKFHGRNPGKKQTEKRISRRDKKEMLKQMNSSDTPLGTLSKQLRKQEQLQTPYLVLSGSGRSDHTSLKKE
ncbi:SART-1 family protein [Dictyocaulus viviparus]|uniref:SART-1 family protein n=1 Tax=Dictyocaulus viviparus TaxID=29172 RepID=A0A0D8Y380_DICVI|nr:SART-1 family protein [Dictyocaulus viviparus]